MIEVLFIYQNHQLIVTKCEKKTQRLHDCKITNLWFTKKIGTIYIYNLKKGEEEEEEEEEEIKN
jgi:hypothetical protein